jgi:hypothetical protein
LFRQKSILPPPRYLFSFSTWNIGLRRRNKSSQVCFAAHEEDLNFLADGLKKVIEKHGVDHEPLRKKVENIYKMDQWENGINAGIGIYLDLAKEQLDLIKEAGFQWITSYFTIAEKREKETATSEEVALMDSARARIMEYYFLGDMSITVAQKIGVPLEALTLGTLAPTIRY